MAEKPSCPLCSHTPVREMTTATRPQTLNAPTPVLTLNLWGCMRHRGKKGICCICGSAVQGRRRSWCSQSCVDLYLDNHNWARASWVAKVRAGHCCTRCGARRSLQANHIVPVNGGSREGCASHQDGLEALCLACHGKTTSIQRAAGLIG